MYQAETITNHLRQPFRNKLEAQWAAFFETLGFLIQYEVRISGAPAGWYLPSFMLGREKIWIDIKEAGADENPARYKDLAVSTRHPVLCIKGSPRCGDYIARLYTPHRADVPCPSILAGRFAQDIATESSFWLTQGVLSFPLLRDSSLDKITWPTLSIHSPRITAAFAEAQSLFAAKNTKTE